MSISSETWQQLMMMSGLGVLCWLMLRRRWQRRKRSALPVAMAPLKHNANVAAAHNQFRGTESLGAPPEILRWQVELHDLGRELKAEIDSKLLAVRAMTQAYDQATRRLSEMIRLAEQVRISPQSPLGHAQNLSEQGWSEQKIASALGLSPADIDVLLSSKATGEDTPSSYPQKPGQQSSEGSGSEQVQPTRVTGPSSAGSSS